MKKLTIEDFKERANKVHNNKYVYDKTDLDNRDGDGKVIVTCQGRFHFEPYKKNDKISIENYNKQAQRDKFKYQLCKDKNLELKYYSNITTDNYFVQVHNDVNDIIKEIINK